jgi:hypothetical protein
MDNLVDNDISMLRAHERLVSYVAHDKIRYAASTGPVDIYRLHLYRYIAGLVLLDAQDTDGVFDKLPDRGDSEKEVNKIDNRIQGIVERIKSKDQDLYGMLQAQNLLGSSEMVCSMYARMVITHEPELIHVRQKNLWIQAEIDSTNKLITKLKAIATSP